MIRSIAAAAMLLASVSAAVPQASPYFRWQVHGPDAGSSPPTNPPTTPPLPVEPPVTPVQEPDPVGDITLSPSYLAMAYEGEPYMGTVTASATGSAQGPFQYVIYDLPPGIDPSDNIVSGTPFFATETRTKILVIPTVGDPVEFERTLRVRPQVMAFADLPTAKVGQTYNRGSIQAFYGKGAPYSISVLPQTLDGTGLTYNAAANRFDGTPTQAGTYTVVFNATDGSGASRYNAGTLVVERADFNLSVEVGAPRNAETQGVPFAARTLVARNASGSVTYSASGTPPQMTVDPSTGAVGGTPTEAGTYQATFTASDASGATATAGPFTIVVQAPPGPSQITANYDVGTMVAGKEVDISGDIRGGVPDVYNGENIYYCRVVGTSSQDLFPGVRLNGCRVGGTPMFPGTFTYAIEIVDSRIAETGWDTAIRKDLTTNVVAGRDRSPFGLLSLIDVYHVDFPGSAGTSFVTATTDQRKALLQDGAFSPAVIGTSAFVAEENGFDQTFTVMRFTDPVVLSGLNAYVMGNSGNAQMLVKDAGGAVTAFTLPSGTGQQTISFPRQPVSEIVIGPPGIRGAYDSPGRPVNSLYQISEMDFVR